MGFSALTTALAVAAAPVPGGATPAPVPAFSFGLAAAGQAQPVGDPAAATAEPSPPPAPAQSTVQTTQPPQPADPAQSTVPGQATDPAQPIGPILSVPADPQAAAPPPGPGDIVVTGRRDSPEDPLQDINATTFEVTQSVDKAIVAPVAYAYEDVMPRPIRQGLRNFLRNLGEPVVFLNYLLQLKPGKAAETVGRFAINTTIGAAGIIDVAKRKPFNLPHRRNGFANTMGYYGVPQGPYFYLPLIGPTTLRDFIGNRLDLIVLPLSIGNQFSSPAIALPVAGLSELNSRIEFDDELREIRATRDPYVAARSYYLRRRQAEIDALHGRGDGTVPIIAPPKVSAKPAPDAPAPALPSPAPVQENPPAPSPAAQ